MADIKFACPHCRVHLEVEQAAAGMTVACPECKRALKIPRVLMSEPPTQSQTQETPIDSVEPPARKAPPEPVLGDRQARGAEAAEQPQSRQSEPAAPAAPDYEPILQRLREGNARFASGAVLGPNRTTERRRAVAGSQRPFAAILTCSDSRVPPEIVFDQGLGDLFVVRTAGHVVDQTVLGTLEFGVAELGIALIVVLGHDRCGAVAAAIEAYRHGALAAGHVPTLTCAIHPAVTRAESAGGDLLDAAIHANIEMVVNRLRASLVLGEALRHGALKIVGARYDLHSGVVTMT